jgi:antirestriction protein
MDALTRREAGAAMDTLFAQMDDAELLEETRKLTEWTAHLDFDAYTRDWSAAATVSTVF